MANTQGGTVTYDLDVDKGKFDGALSTARGQINDLVKDADSSAKSISNSLVSAFKEAEQASFQFAKGLAAITAAGAAAVGFGVKLAGDLETMRAGFVTLLGSAEKADAAIAMIKKDAASTPFELPGLIQANQLLTSVTKDANRSETFLLNIGKALSAMGKGQPELDRIIVNLQQIGAVGKASAVDIKQFAFAGIPIYELLNEQLKKTKTYTVDNSKAIGTQSEKLAGLQKSLQVAEQRQKEFNSKTKESTKLQNQNSIDKYRAQIGALGGSIGKLNSQNGKAVQSQTKLEDAIRDGKITFELLEQVFNDAGSAGGRFANAFKDQAGTFNQLFSNLKDNIGIAASEIVVATGIFGAVKNALGQLVTAIDKFTPATVKGLISFFEFVKNNGPSIVGFIAGGLAPAFVSLAKSIFLSIRSLSPFLLAGYALGFAVQLIVEYLGGWEAALRKLTAAFAFVQAKIEPFVAFAQNRFERLKQILSGVGISGEFGGLKEFVVKVEFYTARALQILSDFYEKAKGFLAFGSTSASATFGQAIEGIFNRLKPLADALAPVFAQMTAQFALAGEVFRTQVAPAFSALITVLQPLGALILPQIINAIKAVIIIITGLVVVIVAVITGIASGLANALPYVAQALEGIIQFFRGFIQLLTGLFTGDLTLAFEGLKQMVKGVQDFWTNSLAAIQAFINGFIKGVIAFFIGLATVLVGDVVPTMLNQIVTFFQEFPQRAYDAVVGLIDLVVGVFKTSWEGINSELSSWPGKVFAWGENIARSFADGFSKLGDWLKEKISAGLNQAKSFLQGQSPPKDGPFREIDKWGFNVGTAWVDGLRMAMNGLKSNATYPTAEIPGSTTAQKYTLPDTSNGVGSSRDVTVNIAQVNDNRDVEVMSREIAFKAAIS